MPALNPPSTPAPSAAPSETWTLSPQQRDDALAQLERDGYTVLPGTLPESLRAACLDAIDRFAAEDRQRDPSVKSVKRHGCVQLDPAFRRLMMYPPALQLAHDVFGPSFHLNQSNFQSRMREENAKNDFVAATGWHADGPRPAQFPKLPGEHGPRMGLHYLKFGVFLTDLTHGNGGSLQVVRGSHTRPELDGTPPKLFNVDDYRDDLVQFDCPPGTVVAFHQAQWHAAPPNLSDRERKNVYISYCPTWMKPLDYDLPREGELPDDLDDEERFLLGEYRPPLRFWLPNAEDKSRLSGYARADAQPTQAPHMDHA